MNNHIVLAYHIEFRKFCGSNVRQLNRNPERLYSILQNIVVPDLSPRSASVSQHV